MFLSKRLVFEAQQLGVGTRRAEHLVLPLRDIPFNSNELLFCCLIYKGNAGIVVRGSLVRLGACLWVIRNATHLLRTSAQGASDLYSLAYV